MNAKKHRLAFLVLVIVQTALAGSARDYTLQGNKLYRQANFNEAINRYDEALVEAPQAMQPKFNKANSYYRLDDLDKAADSYRQVAAESKDMKLVAKARYNLGNCSFQRGSKQRDSNLQKAIEYMEAAIGHWRSVLEIEPENEKAAKNIEVARLIIKDILDQLNKQKQQQDPNQPQDPNQQQQQDQQQQGSRQDPNQPQEQQQQASKQDPNQPQEPNQPNEQQQEQQQEGEEEQAAPDTTAQEILDREQRQREERQILQRAQWQKVERDW